MNGDIRITTAGAGSGKTTELTNLMHREIASGRVRPQSIIAATFTKDAAGELAERVRRKLFGEKLIAEAKRLEESLIGTVHSVCQRLITRFAFEAGLSPQVEVLDELAVEAVVGEAIERVCTLDDVQQMERLSRRLNQFHRETNQPNWKGQIKSVISRAVENGISPDRFGAMAKISVEELSALMPAATSDDLDKLLGKALNTVTSKVDLQTDTTKATLTALNEAQHAARDLENGSLPWSGWIKLTKLKPGKKSESAFDDVKTIAARFEEHPELRKDLADYTCLVFDIAARALGSYRQRKEERGQLDFTDLEARAVELLDHPQVQEVIGEEYDLLLVDEFQDTSPMQLAFFLKLAKLVQVQSIWVGDVKQAIYGFRGSDPELMSSVVRIVRERKGVNPPLNKSYRTRPELCNWFNDLFAPAFADSHELHADDVKLDAARSEDPSLPVPLEIWIASTGDTIQNGEPRKPTADQAANAIAEGIQTMLAAQIQVHDKVSNAMRPLRMRDVVVLCRTNQYADSIAGALGMRGSPVTRESSGLLATAEVSFALACLKRLVDPADSLASATVIALEATRQPEDWLQNRLEWLAVEGNDESRWGLEGGLQSKILQALENERERTRSASPSEVLDEALTVGNAFGTVSAWGPGEGRAAQRRANLEALRGLAARYESLCGSSHEPATVAGFLLWVRNLEKDPIAVDSSADAIQIFTYHGAKGLEWPVVICTELHKEPRPRLWDYVVVVDEETFDPFNPLSGRRLRFWPWPFGQSGNDGALDQNASQSDTGKAAQEAALREELRLLYVGFTRARDQLILETRERSEPVWLQEVFGSDFAEAFKSTLGASADDEASLLGVRAARKTFVPPEKPVRQDAPAETLHWFATSEAHDVKPPAFVLPSSAAPMPEARIGKQIQVGPRLPVLARCEEVDLGNALHAVFAAVLQGSRPDMADLGPMAQQLIAAHGLSGSVNGTEVVATATRLRTVLEEQFSALKILVEVPFEFAMEDGTRSTGFIDLAVETANGWVIVDHKSFQGSAAQCEQKALVYSGQLSHYRRALEASGFSVISQWIHFPVAGILIEVG